MSAFIKLSVLLKKLPNVRHQRSVVLVTGCFDILHSEHIKFLQAAKIKGDILLVGVETDERVSQLKGLGRPVDKLAKRIDKLIKTGIPDYVFVLPIKFGTTREHVALIAALRPDILAVSASTPYLDKKKEIIVRFGGELRVVLPHNPTVSTSRIIQKNNPPLDKNSIHF